MKTIVRSRVGPRRLPAAERPEPEAPGARSPAICVVVADGTAIDRAALSSLIRAESDFLVVAECSNTQEAIDACRRMTPDVLILSLGLPSPVGEPPLAEVRGALPELPILAISERGWSECLVLNPPAGGARTETPRNSLCTGGQDCLQVAAAQGAAGTVRRSADPRALFSTMRAVAAGRTSYEPGTVEGVSGGNGANSEPLLSPRLVEVAHLLSDGRSNKEIASALGISEPTVKKHVTRLLERLGLEDRLQAGLFIARHPLIFSPRHALAR